MIRNSGQSVVTFISWSLRLPYQANVMKMLLHTSSSIVESPRDMIRWRLRVRMVSDKTYMD